MPEISEKAQRLLESKALAALSTVGPNNAPHVTPMWFQWEDGVLKFSHTTYRQKYANIQQNPQVSVLIVDPADPYNYIEVRGSVDVIEPDPTGAYLNHLALKYRGEEYGTIQDAKDRVILHLKPRKIIG